MDKDKENNIIIPTREEFEDFCSLKLGYNDREFTSELWKTCQKVGWRKKNGDPPKSWQTLVICYNGIVLPKFGRKPYKRASVSEKAEKKRSFRITECTISPILTVAVITTRPQKQVDLLTS